MPWRYLPHETPDPYPIWLSEIMLQQTTVTTVRDYFTRFITRWPNVKALASAALDDVLHAWQGLGYYNRAHNLYKCAQIVAHDYDGVFPRSAEALIKLPGLGPYASAAIAAIAFNERIAVIDGNVERVLGRLYRLPFPPKEDRLILVEKLEHLMGADRYGDFAQSMMELGSEICKPQNPKCDQCPVHSYCAAFKNDDVLSFPIKILKKERPQKYTTAYVITNDQDQVLLRRRPLRGLFKGMMEVPTEEWNLETYSAHEKALPETIKHVFTHFSLEVQIVKETNNNPVQLQDGAFFVNRNALEHQALPTLMKKILKVGLG